MADIREKIMVLYSFSLLVHISHPFTMTRSVAKHIIAFFDIMNNKNILFVVLRTIFKCAQAPTFLYYYFALKRREGCVIHNLCVCCAVLCVYIFFDNFFMPAISSLFLSMMMELKCFIAFFCDSESSKGRPIDLLPIFMAVLFK